MPRHQQSPETKDSRQRGVGGEEVAEQGGQGEPGCAGGQMEEEECGEDEAGGDIGSERE